MFKGFLLFVVGTLLTVTAEARVSYPSEMKPYQHIQKSVKKMSKKDRAKLIAKMYEFMVKKEASQPMGIAFNELQSTPEWLDNLLWETAEAGLGANQLASVDECIKAPARRVGGVTYPSACMFAGNLICTRVEPIPPKCNRDFLQKHRPDLLCGGGKVKCNPMAFMKCEGDNRKEDECVDVDALKRADPRNPRGPAITLACIGGRDEATMKAKAEHVSQCANPDDVAGLLSSIVNWCATLDSRSGKGYDKKDFAGNDQDCKDMIAYLEMIKVVSTPPPPPPPPPADPCQEGDKYKLLCQGQDTAGMCGAITYTSDTKRVNDCIKMNISQASSGASEDIRFCNDKQKNELTLKNQQLNPGRGTNWLHMPAKNFNWNDRTKIGRVGSSGPTFDQNGNLISDPVITDKDGYAAVCFNMETGKYESDQKFKSYIDQVVKDPAQNAAVKAQMQKCYDRNKEMLAKELKKKNLTQVRDAAHANEIYEKANSIWAMVKVDDPENKYLSVRRTTGRAQDGKPVCSPDAPCTEGTFVCAQTNYKSLNIKDNKVAEYVTLFSDKMDGKPYGDLQYIDIGTHEVVTTKKKKNGEEETKVEYKKYPVTRAIYDARQPLLQGAQAKPFLTLRDPVELKRNIRLWRDPRESVIYSATEEVCDNYITTRRPQNRVFEQLNDDGSVKQRYVCDTDDGQEYRVWMQFDEVGRAKVDGSNVVISGLGGFDYDTRAKREVTLSFNSQSPDRSCIWKWADASAPTVLIGREFHSPRTPIKDVNRTIQSEESKKE